MEEWRAALMGKAHDKEQLESPAVTEMATTTTSLLHLEENVGDAKEETLEKAQELFQLCDKEEKGFITKQDMQRLQHELPLTSEQLESVFDSLDQSNNGYLTPVEFSMGLGKFIGMGDFRCEETFESGWSDEQGQADDEEQEEERRFCAMMERLGTYQVFGDQSEVRDLWAQLHKEHPELLANFEEFLFRVSSYIQEVHDEKESVEQVLKRKETNHDREVRHLYEEMEQQIKMEKERLLYQDSMKSRGRNALLQKELKNREQELESIVAGQKQRKEASTSLKDFLHLQLEQQLQALNSEQVETRVQNERLRHLNKELQEQLERSKRKLESAQSHLRQLQEEANQEQEQRDRNVFRVSRNMQKEKQSLLRQLEILREMNKKLRDERDAFEAKKLLSLRARAVLAKHSANCFSCCCCRRCHIHQTESLHCHTGHLSPQHPGLSHASSGADCL